MIGQTLGHYRIVEKLGEGGMGVVYRARDERLGRDVALKVLAADAVADETARARLVNEARTASALNHPHICTIHEVGEAEGQTYIVMEYVEGRPLSALVAHNGLPVETVIRYGAQVAGALEHAHERGVIHRDLKSSNMMITAEGRAKVLDFGLAKRLAGKELDEATRSRATLTEAGAVVGTLQYLAPEVLRGEPADARSDLWALGVLLYDMAAGELPFKGQTGYELSSAILRESPAPLPPRVPAGLRGVIQRCLAKEPGQRYQRASEVRAALETIGSDTAIAPAATAPAVSPWRWLWILSGGAVLAGLALLVGSALQRGGEIATAPAKPRVSTGAPASPNPEANEYFEKAMVLGRVQYDLPRTRQLLERALELDPHFAEARAWYGFTNILLLETGYSNDTSWVYKAEEELRRALQDDPNSGRVHSALAAVYIYQGRKELVPGEAEKALKANPNDLDAYNWLMSYQELNGEYAAAQALAKQAMERDPLFFPARMNFGDYLRQQGDLAGAVRAQEKVLEVDPQNVYSIGLLARAHMDGGELHKARLTLGRARPRDRQSYWFRLEWALLLALEGKRAGALKEMDDQLLKYASVVPSLTSSVADFYAVLGETAKALEWLQRAVRNGDDRGEWFRRDPLLASLRNHPRFKQILESIAYRRQQRARSPDETQNRKR